LHFSGPVSVFHNRRLPEVAVPAGYAALIDAYKLSVPIPRVLSAIGTKHRIIQQDGWRIYTPRHAPAASLEAHLTFALKNEGLDLVILKRLFLAIDGEDIAELVRQKPTGIYTRRIWFLYEWLLGCELTLSLTDKVSYVEAVDTDLQFGAAGINSARHRVRNNLPGTPEFCPLVFKTPVLSALIAQDWKERARAAVNDVPKDLLARTAAFLLLKDSKSSYVIEGEQPPQDRIQRWGRALGEAGRAPLDEQELLRLQGIVIGDQRFVKLGFRQDDGFVGAHDRDTQRPIPEHISARHEDIPGLVAGLIAFDHLAGNELDPVVAAAVLAFGFVYIHPFEDGNGRIHRYLMHHVLARCGFNPAGVHFPVSSAILGRIAEYRNVLESYSRRLLPCVQWDATPKNNVQVLNETGDFYSFFDATPHAEFLYECVRQTIEQDLPNETNFLRNLDTFRSGVEKIVDMPERTLNNLFGFLRQNQGRLSKRALGNEFAELAPDEIAEIEKLYAATFGQSAASGD
jgi:Fic family protein